MQMRHESSGSSGIVVSALRGGSGKTILSVGIIAALRNREQVIAPFKKGPDYIDAGWLALAADRPCFNLDTFLINQETILHSFHTHTQYSNLAIIEGNRGLYDCIHTDGKTSTAELSKLLGLPVILCVDATKITRTMAAIIKGCIDFDPSVVLKGVVLNRVAGARHENILTKSIESHCGVPVLGAVPKLTRQSFPERHMGLVPTPEHGWAQDSIGAAGEMAEKYIDLQAIAAEGRPFPHTGSSGDETGKGFSGYHSKKPAVSKGPRPKVGVIRDAAFQFYYPENIDALANAGADIVICSPLREANPPQVDALYIGGGFPETHAGVLSENKSFRIAIKNMAENGLPIYAECGGLMYLGEELVLESGTFPMCGVLPVVFGFSKKPQGHGYTIVRVEAENPFFPKGMEIRGHEFHYSKVLDWKGHDENLAFTMKRGAGLINGRDGVGEKNVLATYTHIHALGTPTWAPALIRNAVRYRATKHDLGH
jgi:cobyrinic acid a,c-diamide synthase